MTPRPISLTFLTGNANKLREVQDILANAGVTLNNVDVDLIEVQGTVEQVARAKVLSGVEKINGPVLVEDTCLVFEAFNNELPGPYIKWFLKQLGTDNLYKMVDGFGTNNAQAVCTFAFCAGPGAEPLLFQGRTDGKIVRARGPQNFGWDAAFEYSGTGETYAEMSSVEKNKISHRGKALEKLKAWLKEQDDD